MEEDLFESRLAAIWVTKYFKIMSNTLIFSMLAEFFLCEY